MKTLQYILGAIAAFALILILLITSVEAVVYWTPGYFEKEYRKHQVLTQVQMEMEDLLEVTDHMMAYLRGDEQQLQIVTTVGGEVRQFFNERELAHMADVKGLFLSAIRLRRMALIACAAASGILIWKKQGRILPRTATACIGVFLTAAALLGLLASTDFTRYFTIFHHIFFSNDLWILNPQTVCLLTSCRGPFFIDTALRIGIVFAAGLTVVLTGSLLVIRKERRAKKQARQKGPTPAA